MKFGHRIHGTITGYDDKGRGMLVLSNQDKTTSSIAVPFSAVGDEMTAVFTKRDHRIKVAKLEIMTSPGPDRVAPRCPHAGVCGGCLWQHIEYEAQLRIKRDMINRAFARAGHGEKIEEVRPCPMPFHYRNRMDFAVGWLGTIGLKEYGGWNRYVDLKTCFLLGPETNAILSLARDLIKDCELEPWDAVHHTGLVRYLVVREGKNTGERMVMLVVSDDKKVSEEARKNIEEKLGPYATSLLMGEQSKVTDISCVSSVIPLKGNPWIEEAVGGARYRLAPNSFFQTNSLMAAELQKTVVDFVRDAIHRVSAPYRLLDLYCGLGFFGIYLTKQFPQIKVSGFEIDGEAIELARHNAKINGVDERAEFVSGPAENLTWKDIPADAVILDPPRAGLHPRVIRTLLGKKLKTMIYVSCNYQRLVEELKEFKKEYRVEALRALDLFPHTPHVEVVVRLAAEGHAS